MCACACACDCVLAVGRGPQGARTTPWAALDLPRGGGVGGVGGRSGLRATSPPTYPLVEGRPLPSLPTSPTRLHELPSTPLDTTFALSDAACVLQPRTHRPHHCNRTWCRHPTPFPLPFPLTPARTCAHAMPCVSLSPSPRPDMKHASMQARMPSRALCTPPPFGTRTHAHTQSLTVSSLIHTCARACHAAAPRRRARGV